MKDSKILITFSTLVILFLSIKVIAQVPDLSYIGVSVTPASQMINPLDQMSMTYTIINNGTSVASGGVFLDIAFDNTNFFYSTFSSTDSDWVDCSLGLVIIMGVNGGLSTPGVTCNYQNISFNPGDSTSITVNYSTTPVPTFNTYDFTAHLVDAGVDEINDGNNYDTKSIVIAPFGPMHDLDFEDAATANTVPLTENDVSPFTINYRVLDLIAASPAGISFEIPFLEDYFTFNDTASTIAAGWSCFASTGFLNCSTASAMAAGDIADFTLEFVATGLLGNAPVNTYPFTATFNGSDLNAGNDTINTNVVISAAPINPDVIITKTILTNLINNEAEVGSQVTYRVLAKNNTSGSVDGSNVVITDILPAGVDFSSINIIGSSFSCLPFNTATNTLTCTAISLPFTTANDGVEISVDVVGNPGLSVNNTANVVASNDTNTSNNSSNTGAFTIIPATLPQAANLSITNTALINSSVVTSITSGETLKYQIVIKNNGGTDAVNVTLIEDLPLDIQLNSINAINWSCNQNLRPIRCTFLSNLISGETTTLEFDVTDTSDTLPAVVNQLRNSAIVSANNTPSVAAINIVIIEGNTNEAISLTVAQSPNAILPGSAFDFIVDVTNLSQESLDDLVVVNTLPVGFSYLEQGNSTCQIDGLVLICNLDTSLMANTTESIIISVNSNGLLNSSDIFTNLTTVSGANIDDIVTRNTAINLLQPGQVSYSIGISSLEGTVAVGSPFDYIVAINNTGDAALNSLDLIIDIPEGLTVSSTSSDALNCSNNSAGSRLTCTATNDFNVNEGEEQTILTLTLISTEFIGDVSIQASATIDGQQQMVVSDVVTINNMQVDSADLSVNITSEMGIEQGSFTAFSVNVINDSDSDSAASPLVIVALEGIISNVTVDQAIGWNCDVSTLRIACQFQAGQMEAGHNSNIEVTIKSPSQVADDNTFTVTASINSTTDDPDISNNSMTTEIGVNGTPTAGEFLEAMRIALDGRGNQQVNRAIQNVASYCGNNYFGALEGFCADLFTTAVALDGEMINTVMEQITPNETIGQTTSVAEIATAQFRNVGARLAQLRGGGGNGFSTAGLNARYGSGSIPLGMLSYLNQSDEDKDNVINTNNDFISPWGFFVNGSISMGERDATGRELGFDFDSYGLTAGVDYRLNATKVIGVALGYANFDSDIDDTAELNSTGITLTGYGSFYLTDNFYVDARISLAKPEFDQSRDINFTLGDNTIDRTARSSTDASQYSFAMSAGYHFNKNSWNITPNASIRYINTSIDGFTEIGAGDFNFTFANQDFESLIWSAGLKVSKAISLKKGVIIPQLDLDYNYESLNDGDNIQARFINAPIDEVFIIETDSPDRSYGSAGVGLVYVSANGKQAYINYRSVLGLEGFSQGTINVGARFEF